jgi:hypothetical protein
LAGKPQNNFRHAATYAVENFGLLHDTWRNLAKDRAAWRHCFNRSGTDFFMQNWLKERAADRGIRHALILASNIVANERLIALKKAIASRRSNRRRDICQNKSVIRGTGVIR